MQGGNRWRGQGWAQGGKSGAEKVTSATQTLLTKPIRWQVLQQGLPGQGCISVSWSCHKLVS